MKTSKFLIPTTIPDGNSSGIDPILRVEKSNHFRIRLIVLLLLCLQNSGHALIARYSQKTLKEHYSTTEVVLVSELIKLLLSLIAVIYERADPEISGARRLTYLLLHSEKMIVLVVVYAVNNVLSYVALGKVDAALYTVLSQLKILTTAGFTTAFFGRILSGAKWRALLLLVLGCILVASPVYHIPDKIKAIRNSQEQSMDTFNSLIGIVVVIIMVVNSGFGSVYLESVLKKEKISVWERNFQLSLLSVLLVIGIIISERVSNQTLSDPIFQGFTMNAYLLALVQAFGGILVAASLKYADSILKTLATCLAIVVTAILENVLMSAPMDIFVIIGCISTILAIANYTFDLTPDSS